MVRKLIAPLIAAMIWGTAFVAQSVGADYLPPFTFNAIRSMVAVVTLSVIFLVSTRMRRHRGQEVPKTNWKALLRGGLLCGTAMAIATGFQQMGLGETDAGKAGFISAMYIVMVPLLGMFFHRKASVMTGFSVVIAVAGLFLLCVSDALTIEGSDLYIMLCALCFAVQILFIDHYAPMTDCIALSLVQFSVMAAESALIALIFEAPPIAGIRDSLVPLLYLGIFSSGVAYTLQIVAQKGSDPTMVSLILSLESVFGAIAGALILHETMSVREYFGCALMLMAVMLSQLPATWFSGFFRHKHAKL